jgi:peptidoglycan/LPS O-acetylase OafA/YrhL
VLHWKPEPADQRSVSTGYVPEIDGIRAVAVGAVIVFHLWPGALPGGFTGVDMFFVVSGFVVTRSLLAREFVGFRALALDFYARRAVRILPALIVMLLATVLATQLFVPQAWLAPDPSQVGLAAFFGFSNMVLMNDANSYFAPAATLNPFTHTWSLGVEEQFYLVFPLLLYWSRQSGQQTRMLWLVAGLSFLSLALSAYLGATLLKHAFYSIFSRFWELGTGVLLCLTQARWRLRLVEMRPALRTAFVLACVSTIAAGLVLARPDFFPFPFALLPVLGTAGLIATVCSFPGLTVAGLLRSGPAVSTGRLSYSLYLWHWPVIVLFRWTVGLDSLALEIAAFAMAVALALASYRLVERPLRVSAWRRATSRGGVIRIGFGSAALAYLTATILVGNPHLSLSVTRDRAAWYAEPDYPLDPALTNCSLRQQEAGLAGGSRISWSQDRCKKTGSGIEDLRRRRLARRGIHSQPPPVCGRNRRHRDRLFPGGLSFRRSSRHHGEPARLPVLLPAGAGRSAHFCLRRRRDLPTWTAPSPARAAFRRGRR